MLRLSTLLAAFIFAAAVFSAAQNSIQPPIWASKPDVAAFERTVKDRIAGAQSSIEKVTAVKGSRNIENTLAPFDDAVRQLNAASYLAGLMQQVHPDAPFRDKATDMVREFTELQGIMGGHYARRNGESEAVATALAEQYNPVSTTRPPGRTRASA